MPRAERFKIKISSKGQIVLPKVIRRRRQWGAGTPLVVEETAEGVLLKSVAVFARTNPQEVFGSLPFSGRPKSIEEMNINVLVEAGVAKGE